MSISLNKLRDLNSPVDLLALANLKPASEPVGAALDAFYATRTSTPRQRKIWGNITPHKGWFSRQSWPKARERRLVACVGRRGLKTSGLLAPIAVFETLCVDHDKYAAEQSRIYSLVIAPVLKQSREAMRAIRNVLDSLTPKIVTYDIRGSNDSPEIVITSPKTKCERVISVQVADAISVRGTAVCFLGVDECAFLPSEEWLAQKDEDILRAVRAGMVQFPNAVELLVSTPGPPAGVFYDLVSKPPRDTLIIQSSSWAMNPDRITRADCRRLAGDEATLDQEYGAMRFGFHNESFLDSAAVYDAIEKEASYTGKGPRPGHFIIAYDAGQLQDDAAIVCVSNFFAEVSQISAPVRHVVVEHAEKITARRKDPVPLETQVARVVTLATAYGNAPVLFDQFSGPTVKAAFEKLGYREAPHGERPRTKQYRQVSMAPTAQTPRWKLLRDLFMGRRIHIHPNEEWLAKEVAGLKATQQSSGAIKVEGKKDNGADALALACELVVQIEATGHGSVQFDYAPLHFGECPADLHGGHKQFFKVINGRRVSCEPPFDPTPGSDWFCWFEQVTADDPGLSTPSIQRYRTIKSEEPKPEETNRENERAFPINHTIEEAERTYQGFASTAPAARLQVEEQLRQASKVRRVVR